MDADLDLLLIYVFCIADDLLPAKTINHRRSLTDAEVVTLGGRAVDHGNPQRPRGSSRTAIKRLGHLFPNLTQRSGFYRRRDRLAGTIEALIASFARLSPGWEDNVLLIDSTPVECARSRETVKRAGASSLDDALANAADYGYCASHSRYFYGLRLHTLCAPDGTPRAMILTSPKDNERDICLRLLERVNRTGPLTVIGDKGYAGRQFEADAARPPRHDPPAPPQRRARTRPASRADPPTDRIDLLDRERHPHPRTPRRPHPARTPRPHRQPPAHARRRDRTQPPTRTPQPLPRRLHLLKPWNYSSRRGRSRGSHDAPSPGAHAIKRHQGRVARPTAAEGIPKHHPSPTHVERLIARP